MGIFQQFPYSNFHEYNLDELIKIVKQLSDDWAAYQVKWGNLYDDTAKALEDFKEYVQEYWDTLDLTEEVNTVLASMLNAGAFDPIILQQLSPVVTDWLQDNINVPVGVVIDSSLSIAGACADAKATGDADKRFYNMLGDFNVFDMIPYMTHTDATYDGITWTWVDDTTVHANGTATQTTGINLFASSNTLPPFMKAGHYYNFKIDPPQSVANVFIEVFDYSGGVATRIAQIVSSNDFVYIPEGITGMIIRTRIFGGQTVSHDISLHILDTFNSMVANFANMFEGSISANYPKANMDLNDVTGNKTYIVDSVGVANAPLASGDGILICSGSKEICTQLFIYTTGIVYTRYINKNTSTYTDWTPVKPLDSIYRMGAALTTGNLDNLQNAGYIFINDPNTVQSLPEAGAGFLWVYKFTSTGIIYQEYTAFTSMNKYRRKLYGGIWGTWIQSGSGTGSITNNYTITTSPVIDSSTDNWLTPVVGDNTGAIMSMLNSTGICRLSEGVFTVSGNIDMPAGSMIMGCGKNTVLRLDDAVTTGYVIKVNSSNTVKDLTLKGSDTSPTFTENTDRSGIYFTNHNSPDHNILSGLFIENFTGSGIYCDSTGGGITENIVATNICIDACKTGININYYSEYHKFTNCVIFGCDTACVNNGGNNIFTACSFNGNTGFIIDNSNGNLQNPGHGSCIGCTFNHVNSGNAIIIKGNNVTFTFSGCQNWYGSIDIQNSKGIIFGDCAFGGSPIIDVTNSISILFSNCIFYQVPTITNVNNVSFIMANCYHSANGLQILP